jgi:hypothetical protein
MTLSFVTVQSDWFDVFVTNASPSLAASSVWLNVRQANAPLRTATLADFRHRRPERNDTQLHISLENNDNDDNNWLVFQRGSPFIAAAVATSVSAMDASGQLVALGRDSGSVEIFNALTGDLLRSVDAPLAHVGDVSRVRFFPSGMVLLTCGIDGRAQIIDVSDGEVAATLRAHAGAVLGSAMIERGRTLITSGRDGTVRLWDVSTQTVLHSYELSPAVPAYCMVSICVPIIGLLLSLRQCPTVLDRCCAHARVAAQRCGVAPRVVWCVPSMHDNRSACCTNCIVICLLVK